jgi:hypothetical protein
MADTIPISQLAALPIDQVTAGDVFPITNADGDNNTYKLTLSNLDTFIKTSPSSSKVFVGTIGNATFATSSATASFANTASFASGSGVTALTSSYAQTSSISITAISAAYANVANTVLNPLAVTNVQTSSITYFLVYNPAAPNNGTASMAITSSIANTSSYSSIANTSSYSLIANTSSYSSIANTSSYSLIANTASYINNALQIYGFQNLKQSGSQGWYTGSIVTTYPVNNVLISINANIIMGSRDNYVSMSINGITVDAVYLETGGFGTETFAITLEAITNLNSGTNNILLSTSPNNIVYSTGRFPKMRAISNSPVTLTS